MQLPDARGGNFRRVQMLSMKPENYRLGSLESRIAARALLEARERRELAEERPQMVSLAETIQAARMKAALIYSLHECCGALQSFRWSDHWGR
jgi:hypothetical protein